MEPDLSHSITHHPHPFRLQSNSTNSTSSLPHPPRSATGTPSANNPEFHSPKSVASSTAIETLSSEDATSAGAVARHFSTTASDLEAESQVIGTLPRGTKESDPYGLSAKYKSAVELQEIKANTSRKRDGRHGGDDVDAGGSVRSDPDNYGIGAGFTSGRLGSLLPRVGRTALQARRVTSFYEAQNETIERLLKSVEEHRAEARQEQGDDQLKYRIAVWGSFVANVILAILQLYGAISSGSLSLFTTMADAIFDPLSNVTLILTNRAVRRVDPSRFPSGKARLETIGNIVFCFLMTAVSFILIAFSIRDLVERDSDELNSFHLPSVIAVAVAFVTKLSLFFYTWSIKDKYSQIGILWQDHRNDLLINGFGILTSVGGSKLVWWLDPAGAIVLSVLVSGIWLRTAFAEFMLLVGVTASVEIQQLITYVSVTHSQDIKQIDTVRVYHSGPRLIAEVDIVMDPSASLQKTHDVAEELQLKLESLPDVERAYVHVDYETTHKPEHAYKKDL
jgi:cation diffusion facilitator family transporter